MFQPFPFSSMPSGSSQTKLWSTGGLFLGSCKSSRCHCSNQRSPVLAGTVVYKAEALQGHGERYDDTQQ